MYAPCASTCSPPFCPRLPPNSIALLLQYETNATGISMHAFTHVKSIGYTQSKIIFLKFPQWALILEHCVAQLGDRHHSCTAVECLNTWGKNGGNMNGQIWWLNISKSSSDDIRANLNRCKIIFQRKLLTQTDDLIKLSPWEFLIKPLITKSFPQHPRKLPSNTATPRLPKPSVPKSRTS